MNNYGHRVCRIARIAGFAALSIVASGSMLGQAGSASAPENAANVLPYAVHFDHATISVAGLDAEAAWYVHKLGLTLTPPPQGVSMPNSRRLDMPGFRLDLIRTEGSERPKTPANALLQQGIAYLAFSVSDLHAALQAIKGAGIETEPSHSPQGKVVGFIFHDPEGNQIEFFGH